jgi:succinate dehydrogenase/fumarate reductase-like Fe-S protein
MDGDVAHDPQFTGPPALNRLFTLQSDSRDGARSERAAVMRVEDLRLRCDGQA